MYEKFVKKRKIPPLDLRGEIFYLFVVTKRKHDISIPNKKQEKLKQIMFLFF